MVLQQDFCMFTWAAVPECAESAQICEPEKKKPARPAFPLSNKPVLVDARIQFALVIALDHGFQADGPDLGGVAGGAEGFVARLADVPHGLGGGDEEFARIEFLLVFSQELAHRAGG